MLLAGYVWCASLTNGHVVDARLQSQLEEQATRYISDHPEIPALYAFVAKNGRVEASVALGVTDAAKTIRATRADQLRIGSNSKSITATLMAVLVDRGVLSWTSSVGKTFPELAKEHPGNKALEANLWQLLCHHGGFREMDVYAPALKGLRGKEWRARYLDLALANPDNPGPGDESIYGPGPIAAAAIAERLTGRTFEQLFEQYLGEPLGLRSFVMGRGPKTPRGWWFREDSNVATPSPLKSNDYIENDPGGGICLSMTDMAVLHSLRAGVVYKTVNGLDFGISRKNRDVLNTAPWAEKDGAALGMYYGLHLGTRLLEHAGNTGCGDWSSVTLVRGGTTVCFFHVNYNRPGDDPRPALDFKDWQTSLRTLALQDRR